MTTNINQAVVTQNTSNPSHKINAQTVDSVQEQDETIYENTRWATDWGYFNKVPKLKSAILMKAIWTVGKGYEADTKTKVILEHIIGNGKETFNDILFNLVVCKQIGRDSFAEIIKDKETGNLLNLRVLDPGSIRIVFDKNGMIKRYEQSKTDPQGKKTYPIKFKPEEIFHLTHNGFAGQIHGISVPESVERIILADDANFKIMNRLTQFQAVPFIIWKLKTDDPSKVSSFRAKLKDVNKDGEDLIIPDDENLVSWEVVQVNPSAVLMQWRDNVNSEFYRAVGMPLVLFGSSNGSTESGSKVEYLGHETVFENDQRYLERQVEAQLGLTINLISPTSLLENMQTDERKDAQNALRFQPNDVEAGVGE